MLTDSKASTRRGQVVVTYRIQDARSGTAFGCRDDESLLQAMRQSGEQMIAVGCLGGGCGLCKVRIVSGDYTKKKMSTRHISANDAKQRYALACRVFPQSDLLFEVVAKQ